MTLTLLELSRYEERLRVLARQMLAYYPTVGRWDETDDILQEALVRLDRALSQVRPQSDLHMMRLGALQIRRVLIDLARRYSGSDHFAKNHESWVDGDRCGGLDQVQQSPSEGAFSIDDWTEFHQQAETLAPHLREVVDLVWYMGLSHRCAGEVLSVTERTVERRWRSARLELHRRLSCVG